MSQIRAPFRFFLVVALALARVPVALATDDPAEVMEKLQALPGVTAVETTRAADRAKGYLRFSLTIEQPVDHAEKSGPTFQQRLVLFHKGFNEPLVLQTSGYKIFAESLTKMASLFEANQIQVEHRYFDRSTPAAQDKDWAFLSVRQSAADFHKVTTTLKSLYPANWVGTGASKGGMTSIYHRRFYPGDLQGTVADVAPISFSLEDERYVEFLDEVGGEEYAECRERLESYQQALLRRKPTILPLIEGSYTHLGGVAVSFEHAVIELPFIFWQYGDPTSRTHGCGNLPSGTSSGEDLYRFMVPINRMEDYADDNLREFASYYYQAATELGAPAAKRTHLDERLEHPYSPLMYIPKGETTSYSNTLMKDVETWVAREAERVIFVYGEYDPWTAGAFTEFNPSGDNHWFMLPAGNHSATFSKLPSRERTEATEILARWLGKSPVQHPGAFLVQEPALEDLEFLLRPRF